MKYEILKDEFIDFDGRKLYRIKALKDFRNVKAAEVGGYIESEQNLSQEGGAWVSGNARVYGAARVLNRHSVVWFSNVGTENGTLTVYCGKNGLIATRGCFTGSVEEFLIKSARVHNEKTRREYELLIEVARSRLEEAQGDIGSDSDDLPADRCGQAALKKPTQEPPCNNAPKNGLPPAAAK